MANRKREPLRKCIGCGEMKPKKELIRVLHTEQDEFILDIMGKKNGRGAYLCRSQECLQKAVKNKGLERSFKQTVPAAVYESLKREMDDVEAE